MRELKGLDAKALAELQPTLESLSDDEFALLNYLFSKERKDPDVARKKAWFGFIGLDHFYLGSIWAGIFKLICTGLAALFPSSIFVIIAVVWWIVDIARARQRAFNYNRKIVLELLLKAKEMARAGVKPPQEIAEQEPAKEPQPIVLRVLTIVAVILIVLLIAVSIARMMP